MALSFVELIDLLFPSRILLQIDHNLADLPNMTHFANMSFLSSLTIALNRESICLSIPCAHQESMFLLLHWILPI